MNQYNFIKNKVLYVMLFVSFCNFGCKYDEGPAISFKDAKYRVTGTYKLDHFYVNDTDTASYYNSLMCNSGFAFSIEGSDRQTFIRAAMPIYIPQCLYNFQAQWVLNDHNNILTISRGLDIPIVGPWGQFDEFDWNIIKLTDHEMHIGGKSYDTTYRLEFKKI